MTAYEFEVKEIAGFHGQAIKNKNLSYKIKTRIVNMIEGKDVNIQAEIQASAIFHMRDIRGTIYPSLKASCWCLS